jgi:hypothetical protein
MCAQRPVAVACRQAAHIGPRAGNGVHPDPVAQQGAAGLFLGGIDGDHGKRFVREMVQVAPYQFVGHAGFAGAARAGDADDGDILVAATGSAACWRAGPTGCCAVATAVAPVPFSALEIARAIFRISFHSPSFISPLKFAGCHSAGNRIAGHVFDHPLQPHPPAVVGGIDAGDPILMQLFDLAGEDGAAAAAKEPDMPAAVLVQQVLHVFEKFQVAALVGRDGDALYIFFDGALHDLGYRPVMSQVNDLRAFRLQQAPHDIDRGVMTIEKGGGGNEADFMDRGIAHNVNVWQTSKFTQKTNEC